MFDISPDYKRSAGDSRIMTEILKFEKTPEAINYFDKHKHQLTNYGYWFGLSTLWVSYNGWSDLDLWKKLFSSNWPNRKTSIMKPSELNVFNSLPDRINTYRAHRKNETDWISYTLNPEKAGMFAKQRDVDVITMYEIPKDNVIAVIDRERG